MEHKRLLVQPEDTTDDEGGYDSVSEDIELDSAGVRLTMEQELQLQQDEEEEEEELREHGIYTFLRRPAIVYPMEIAQIFLSFLWSIAYVYLANRQFAYPSLLRGTMYGWVCFFVAFWTWKVIVKENRLKHLCSLFALMDYLTLVPFFVDSDWMNPLMSLRVVCMWRLFRVFPTTISPVIRSVLKLIASIFMLVYISAAFLLAVEPEVMQDFVTACYFATVTISTVGYGDIHMSHIGGRILVIAIILCAFVFIPWQGYFLSKIIAMTPYPWQRALDVDVRKYRHVVLTGKITRQRVSMFLREFLTAENDDYRVVILDAEDQGAAFEKYIKDSGYWKRVRYYVGSPIADQDLHRVHLAEASAAFVWSDTAAANPEQADRMAVLTCLAIKSHSYWLKVFVEVILPETKARIGEVGPNMFVMSYLETKNSAIARACEVEGLLAFCSVLLTTFGPPSTTTMDGTFTHYAAPQAPMLGVLPGHSASDQTGFGPSPAQLAEAAMRRGESHETRMRAASSSSRPGSTSFRSREQLHHMHGSHRSFHVKSKDKKKKSKSPISKEEMLLKRFQEEHGPWNGGPKSEKVPQSINGDSSESEMSDRGNQGTTRTDRPTLENAYREYLWTRTCSLEILVVPATFADRTFSEAASSLYTTYGVILVGLRSLNGNLELNPGPEYIVRGGEAAYIIGRPRDVRLLKQTFDRMARGDGTAPAGASGKTLEYALDPRLEQSPHAPRSLRKSTADDSFVESVKAAAEATLQERDPFEDLKNSYHVSSVPRTYEEAQNIPSNKPPAAPKEGPRSSKYTTFTPSNSGLNWAGPPALASQSASYLSSSYVAPSSFGPTTPHISTRRTAASSSSSHIAVSFGAQSPPATRSMGPSATAAAKGTGASRTTGTGQSTSAPLESPSPLSTPSVTWQHTPESSSSFGPAAPSAASSEESSGLHDHVIFCSHTEDIDWYSLVKPLRSKLLSQQRAVVLVTEYPVGEEQWEWLSYFPNVWVVEGSPLVASDLARAQIETSNTIVILSSPRLAEDETVLDEKAIVVYNSVKAHFSHKRIFLDLAKPSNSRLAAPEVGRVGIYENPEFIAGHLYDCALHDTIMAKSFDMPFLMDLTRALLSSNETGASLITVPVPESCKGAHFEALFSAFPECVPLGLLRRNPIPALRKFPYVCICPPQSALIGSKDQVFLLAPQVFMLRRAAKLNRRRAAKGSSASASAPYSSAPRSKAF
jgi:hypothetical protein